MAERGEFSSRMGFILAAAGSAVGLGNIWGFPTQAASNGGAAYLLVYLTLAFCLAYPAFVAELIIGRHARANAVSALRLIARGPVSRALGALTGFAGIVTASLILSFYSIVAGWTLGYGLASLAELGGFDGVAAWLIGFGSARNLVFSAAFIMLTAWIISAGVKNGIERWSARLMPALLLAAQPDPPNPSFASLPNYHASCICGLTRASLASEVTCCSHRSARRAVAV